MNENEHRRDEDCTLDENDECVVCHVIHGDPCEACGGRGYHRDDCKEMAEARETENRVEDCRLSLPGGYWHLGVDMMRDQERAAKA